MFHRCLARWRHLPLALFPAPGSFAGLLMFFGVIGCGTYKPPRVSPDLPDPSAAKKAMELYDTNHDDFLEAKELEHGPGLMAAFQQVIAKQGKISEQDIADRIKAWADSRLGRTQIMCHVTHNGKPLAGANVVFAPEKFLGGTIQSGSGTTSPTGYAEITSPHPTDPSIQGLSPGFYRVEVTKDGEKIPAKYNTETTLGREIPGSEGAKNGFDFKLEY